MKINCPNCSASGNIPEHEIPEDGRFLNCPRCKHGFTVMKPASTADSYLVNACPACNYSTFEADRFSTCPKCGVVIKAFVERQREAKQHQRDQDLLNGKSKRAEPVAEPQESTKPVADFIDQLHPVKLVAWGCALAAITALILGIMGLLDYQHGAIKAALSKERDMQISSLYVFTHYGMLPWLKTLFGLSLLATVYYFLEYRLQALKVLTVHVWGLLGFIPLYQLICFIRWILQPIPHSFGGYCIEIISMLFITALFCIPLYLLVRFLDDKRIVSVVKLT